MAKTIQLTSAGAQLRTASSLLRCLERVLEQLTDGNITQLARLIGAPKNTVWMWFRSDIVPTLEYLSRLAWVSGTPLHSLLIEAEEPHIGAATAPKGVWSQRDTREFKDWNDVSVKLLRLCNSESPDACIAPGRIARLLQVDAGSLKARFPAQYELLRKRYVDFTERSRREKHQRFVTVINRVVRELVKVGASPTRRKVERLLHKQGIQTWWRQEHLGIWREAVNAARSASDTQRKRIS
ncbi:MAG TPA: hypothetical protein VNJ47_07190 [Nevskiales bacterium]|nr:hypothetical protein [Nevskiales bacterium]